VRFGADRCNKACIFPAARRISRINTRREASRDISGDTSTGDFSRGIFFPPSSLPPLPPRPSPLAGPQKAANNSAVSRARAISADEKCNGDKNYYRRGQTLSRRDVINYRQLFRAANCIMHVRRIQLPKNAEKCMPRGRRDENICRKMRE